MTGWVVSITMRGVIYYVSWWNGKVFTRTRDKTQARVFGAAEAKLCAEKLFGRVEVRERVSDVATCQRSREAWTGSTVSRIDPQGYSTKVTALGRGFGIRVLRDGQPIAETFVDSKVDVAPAIREILRWVDKCGSYSDMASASRDRAGTRVENLRIRWIGHNDD